MTDDRSLERAARSWLEAGPTGAPDRAVEAALARIQTTAQERDLRVPWRLKPMFDRLAAAAVAIVAIGGIAIGYSLMARPNEPAAGPCPTEIHEGSAVNTFRPGLTQAQRAWGISGGTPERVRAGAIALFAYDPENAPLSVVMIDPATGDRCRLLRFLANGQIGDISSLDWSPSGDALAIAFRGLVETDQGLTDGDGQVLVWTRDQLFRVWSGPDAPRMEWAPDGRSMLVWSSDGSMGPDGKPTNFDTRLIFADGSPDRAFDFFPYGWSLFWSPDGGQWVVAEATEADINPDTAVSLVQVADGRLTPLDVGTGNVQPLGWTDHDSVIVRTSERGRGVTGYLEVPIADARSSRVLLGPEERLSLYAYVSPDGTQLLYLSGMDENADGGDLNLIEMSGVGDAPVRLAQGTTAAPTGFAWSPDGSQVMFQARAGGLWTVNVDGSGLRQIASGDIVAVDSPWQPVPVR